MIRNCIFASLFLLVPAVLSAAICDTKSPDGNLVVQIETGPAPVYSVLYKGQTIVAPSRLGLTFKGADPFGALELKESNTKTINETWEYPWGRQLKYVDHCTETTVTFTESQAPGRTLRICFRAYNDGIAFRYLIDEKTVSGKDYVLENDLTEFNFPGNPTAWFTSYPGFKTSQEEFFPKASLRDMSAEKVIGCPVVVQCSEKGPFVALTEADAKNWGGLFFKKGKNSDDMTQVLANVAPRHDGNGLAQANTPDVSSWRVLIVADKAINLVDQTIVMNVSEPLNKDFDWSWIQPGCASWDWWSDSNKVMNTQTIKGFIDLAASMGWTYTFIDDPWYAGKKYKMGDPRNNVLKANEDIDMDEVLRYAKEKNVRLFLWFHWEDLSRQLDDALKLYEKWGIAGLKIDFMDREDQEIIQWYDMMVKKAAEHKMLVDYHGAFKPNGYRRSHPNLITREGIRGNEYNKWSKLTPEHYCTLPYTRLMLGPGDFTPGAFLNRYHDGPNVEGYTTAQGIGTRAHELAVSLLYDSPILCLCDAPQVYQKETQGLDFYRDLPTVWDESKGVAGEIGQYFSQIRRKGNDWYYGAITNREARTLELSLDFLGKGQYEATIYADTPETPEDARKIGISKKTVSAKDRISVSMQPEGGQVIKFKKLAD